MSETRGVGNHRAAAEVVALDVAPDVTPADMPPPPKSSRGAPWTSRSLPAMGFLRKESWTLPPNSGAPRRVADIMTRKVIAVAPHSSLATIDEGMKRFGIRHLPVIGGDNQLVGVLSQRALMHAESSSLSADRATRDEVILQRGTVAHIMARDPITIAPDGSLQAAGKLLLQYKIGCLPVVEEGNKLVGIVTRSDFVKLALHYMARQPAE